MGEQSDDRDRAGARVARRRWIAAFAALAVVVVVVLLVVFLTNDKNGANHQAASDTGSATAVTSPYDFSELPEDSGPAQVADASYVSVLLADEAGQLTAYGLDSSMPAAEALKQAVLHASEVDSAVVSSVLAPASTGSSAGAQVGSTLTFVFPDRGKLTFVLYVDEGLVGRGDKAWAVAGDLASLVAAAVAAGQQ